jgi:hypothetical protein
MFRFYPGGASALALAVAFFPSTAHQERPRRDPSSNFLPPMVAPSRFRNDLRVWEITHIETANLQSIDVLKARRRCSLAGLSRVVSSISS